MRYDYGIQHVPGKLLYTTDTLSRAPQLDRVESLELQKDVESFIENVCSNLPASRTKPEIYQRAQSSDHICSKIMEYCSSGWPARRLLDAQLQSYWKSRNSFSLLLLYNKCIVVPPNLREETLEMIHEGHQGVERCRLRINS